VIESLRSKYHCLGQQTVDYRHKLRQQVNTTNSYKVRSMAVKDKKLRVLRFS